MAHGDTIRTVEYALLRGVRPRSAGSNARLGDHGLTVDVPLVRLTTADGATGLGRAWADQERAVSLLGLPVDEVVSADGVAPDLAWAEFALLDLAARRHGVPVYRLLAPDGDAPGLITCYDTTLYFDDLAIEDNGEAVGLIAGEARQGLARGHRHFKIKIGRGARHMPLEQGMARDVAIIHAVREVAGPEAMVMVDANNGFNLNLTKRVIEETASANLFWFEEAFHEDAVLYADLQAWLEERASSLLVADGEGSADPALVTWALDGLIDVVQYDIFSYGFSRWLALGAELDAAGVGSAPHNYGTAFGNYASGHLASRIDNLIAVEWDHADVPEIDASGYTIADGTVSIPDRPGFGLDLDDAGFAAAVERTGFSVTAGSATHVGGRSSRTA